jgi:hypothetical protein
MSAEWFHLRATKSSPFRACEQQNKPFLWLSSATSRMVSTAADAPTFSDCHHAPAFQPYLPAMALPAASVGTGPGKPASHIMPQKRNKAVAPAVP